MKVVVYTCITGGYDCLKEVPKQFMDKDLDFVCYTDDPNLKSETWKIRMIPEQLTRLSKVKQQRIIKICPTKFLPEYEASLWIDGSMEIVGSVKKFLEKCDLRKYPLWTIRHPQRNCIYAEEKAVLDMRKDRSEITGPQMRRYLSEGYPRNYGLAETRLIYRNHRDEKCKQTMFLWANEILRGSHRDQLSFNYCCWKKGLKYGEFEKGTVGGTFKWFTHHPKENNKSEKVIEKISENCLKTTESRETSVGKVDSVDIYTVNFNHSELTNAWIKSVLKNVSGIDYRIFVVDNSDQTPFVLDESIDKSLVTVIDNTDDKVIPVKFAVKNFANTKVYTPNRNGTFKHCLTIQYILDSCKRNNLLIFDCDTILKRNLDFMDSRYATIAALEKRPNFKDRFLPYIQYFNVQLIRQNRIKYFDQTRIIGGFGKFGIKYDTGASFYEDISRKKLLAKEIFYPNYVAHCHAATYENKNIRSFLMSTQDFWNTNFDVIVSLTTWKNRLKRGNLKHVLTSLLNQKTSKHFKIVLTLFKEDYHCVDTDLKNFLEVNSIEVIIANLNLRPHLKYFYVMQKYRNVPIITVDDDCLYSSNLIEDLYKSYQNYSDCISAKRVHFITYDESGKAKAYKEWVYECKSKLEPSINLIATGVAGVLYPPNILNISDSDIEKIKISITNDDLFLKSKENELGLKTVFVPSRGDKYGYKPLPESVGEEALAISSNHVNNDIYIHTLEL